ncbi:MAG: TonB family protein, partial [Ignavibacteriales bacterium]|nr:TonB family protein [Ignavibacteriales bacterium]
GTVIDLDSREPIGAAKVSILGTNFSATTSKDGQYKIEGIPDGYYQIKAEADKYESKVENNVQIYRDIQPRSIFFTLSQKSSLKEIGEVEKQPDPIYPPVWPVYPKEAREKGIEGVVYVKMLVNEKGVVEKAVVEQSDAEVFNKSSIDAAMKWRFKPALQKGTPVSTWVVLPFKFKLSDGSTPAPNKK